MTPTFHQLWEQREQHAQDLLAAERALANYVDDEDRHEIEDLRDPSGKRFLFDDSEGMAQQSTSAFEAILGGYMDRLRACESYAAPECACAFVEACEHACVTCAQICTSRHARAHLRELI